MIVDCVLTVARMALSHMVVLHTEVIHHQDKGYRASGVTEKTRGVGLKEIKGLERRGKT
jgi:hypothetical protein